jgi:hypothetical protein
MRKILLALTGAAVVGAVACSVVSPPGPAFSCSIVSMNRQPGWHVDVTVTGPTPDISGGPMIIHLVIGYYDANGSETGTGWGMNGLNGFSVAAGQSLTYQDVTDGTGEPPVSCQVQSY